MEKLTRQLFQVLPKHIGHHGQVAGLEGVGGHVQEKHVRRSLRGT